MTQGGNDPLNPPSSPSTASLSGVARCWHSNAYSSLFSSLFFEFHRRNFSRFRRTFHSFDPVGFAIFANPAPTQPNASSLRPTPNGVRIKERTLASVDFDIEAIFLQRFADGQHGFRRQHDDSISRQLCGLAHPSLPVRTLASAKSRIAAV